MAALLEVYVEHVVADVEVAIDEPAEVGCVVIVEGDRERPVPGQLLAGEIRPEPDMILRRFALQGLEVLRLQACPGPEFGAGLEAPCLVQD